MKSFHAEQPKFLEWLIEIGQRTKEGEVICPLMCEPEHAGRFKPAICTCDIPHTRSKFFEDPGKRTCFDKEVSACIPAQELFLDAQNERRNTLPPRLHYPRGAWAMRLKENGSYQPWWAPHNGHRNCP